MRLIILILILKVQHFLLLPLSIIYSFLYQKLFNLFFLNIKNYRILKLIYIFEN